MKPVVCSRVWQVEAARDARLGPVEQASFARHLPGCQDCTTEQAALNRLDETMASLPEPRRTELEHRRERQVLLGAADATLAGRATSRHLPWLQVSVATAGLALAAGIVFHLATRRAMDARTSASPRFEIADVGAARWSEETVGETRRVSLQSGTASFHVEHLQRAERFLVTLPDGQVEVRGTRFVVQLENGHTHGVTVSEGVVALDVPGFSGLIHAGERWPAESPVGSSSALAGASADAPALIPSAREASSAVPVFVASAAASAAAPTAGTRFAEAMAAYSSGNFGRADQLFEAFVRDFPRDGRGEDATYLRADARSRRGDSAGAAMIAKQYLRAYPRGLRRAEAERLAGK